MIDTIVLRIQGYEKYKHIVNQIEALNKNTYVKKFIHEDLQNISKTSLFYADTGRILDVSMRSSIHIPSSHYDISVLPNKGRDFIEFNFSIPKYYHSTNVLQFVDQYDLSASHTFDKLQGILSRFFNEYFTSPPDWNDVEVNRIDLCYNQIFLSKADALRYLDQQRNLNIDYARSDVNKFGMYGDTTVMYKTDNYSFKVYHKGTEFKKNDYPKLIKNNPKGLDVQHLMDTADKILRYELTARKGLLNYIFKQKVKDDENTIFNHHFGEIGKLKNKKRNDLVRTAKTAIYTSTSSKADIFIHKTIDNKSFSFHLDSPWERLDSKASDLLDCYSLCFNKELFCHLHSFFWKKVERYQLGVKMSIVEIHDKIKQNQKDVEIRNELYGRKDKKDQTGLLLTLATLSQYTDVSDLKGILPKATYYRYVKKLQELGIPKHSPDIAVMPPALDYDMYFFYFGKYHHTFN